MQVLSKICYRAAATATIITDSQYCVTGWLAGRAKQMGAFNDDLWHLFFLQVERLQGQVQLLKVKSHLTLGHAVRGSVLLLFCWAMPWQIA